MDIQQTNTVDTGLDGLRYASFAIEVDGEVSVIHTITYPQQQKHLKLIASKSSEALSPETTGNYVGEGGTFQQLIHSQSDLRFIVNGTYNHYRKTYYQWHHDDYEVGDPVGLVKIRDKTYHDLAYDSLNGYFLMGENNRWDIADEPVMESKYILSSRPLLIAHNQEIALPLEEVSPMPEGVVNPPSFLGHGLQNHARTAVGASQSDELVFIVAEGEGVGKSAGISLLALQAFGKYLGLSSLLNLDGGGSSRFWLRCEDGSTIESAVAEEDENRILGHSLMLFSDKLK